MFLFSYGIRAVLEVEHQGVKNAPFSPVFPPPICLTHHLASAANGIFSLLPLLLCFIVREAQHSTTDADVGPKAEGHSRENRHANAFAILLAQDSCHSSPQNGKLHSCVGAYIYIFSSGSLSITRSLYELQAGVIYVEKKETVCETLCLRKHQLICGCSSLFTNLGLF